MKKCYERPVLVRRDLIGNVAAIPPQSAPLQT